MTNKQRQQMTRHFNSTANISLAFLHKLTCFKKFNGAVRIRFEHFV